MKSREQLFRELYDFFYYDSNMPDRDKAVAAIGLSIDTVDDRALLEQCLDHYTNPTINPRNTREIASELIKDIRELAKQRTK